MARRARWKDDLDAWRAQMQRELASPGTVRVYSQRIRAIMAYGREHGWPANPRRLRPEHVQQYYDSIQGLASNTQAHYMTVLLCFLRFVKNQEVTGLRMRIRPERGEVYWPTQEQILTLFSTPPTPRCMAAEVVFTYTGIREMELRTLRTTAVKDKWLIVQAGKGRKARKIPIDDEFWQMLQPYLEWKEGYMRKWGSSPYFLVHPKVSGTVEHGPPMPYAEAAISQMVRKHGESLGYEHITAHSFRRKFGRDLYYAGCPPTQIQRYYGHTSLSQTMEYIAIEDEVSREAMMRYRPSYLGRF